MASIVYITRGNKKYAYRSTSYWDPDKKAPRSNMEYLGRVDESTGEIIPKKEVKTDSAAMSAEDKLRAENRELKKRVALLEKTFRDVIAQEIRFLEEGNDRRGKLIEIRDSVLKE